MKSLYSKFVVVTTGIMLLSGLLAFFISNVYYQQKLKSYNDQKNTAIALNVAAFTDEHPDMNLEEYLQSLSAVGYQIYLVDSSGRETFFGAAFRDKQLAEATKRQVLQGTVYHGILHFPHKTFVTGFFANELKNTIGVPLTHNGKQYALFLRPDIKLLFNEMHLLFGWLLVLAIVLSIVMVVFATNYLVKPISRLTAATKRLAEGDFRVKLDTNRNDELGELSNSFSRMARQLEQTEEMRKEFISNISHDIQSPLSNIKGYTNLMNNESISSKERDSYASIINSEIKRLSTLTKQLLLLASLDRNEDMVKKRPFNVGQQIKELIQSYQWAISEKGILLSYSLPDIEIIGDPSLLNTVWDNLLTNAIKYNKPSGSIDIAIEVKKDALLITFKDTGAGLSRTELERIFERFYRADMMRSRAIEGTGLGLSIAATIMKLHEGHIYVRSKEKEGSAFVVELPLS
ncbi:sensor histidine kinase [Bacillus badius]|uniref:Heme sensor protein HssS n=1 Tax=Bacillus badius TaxID=1455 RepID=A0ABR5AZ41_BACBA|nr:HAMP domain-containing sensor histidine kinase [Bacillus badius]KIL80017.1 Sensor histidine kinase colocalized with HrtAB transporter [Bacillus badius]MED4717947.1 HAMP domain-containing sensor histidine kinase [Bacillus badius]